MTSSNLETVSTVCIYRRHHRDDDVLIPFSRLLMLTLILLGIIINLLPLYRLSYFVFCSFNYFCVFVCTRANFVIGLCAVKFARK
jgi:hypothetical protein